MVKANELRIGNWVKCQDNKLTKNFDGYCKIKVVTPQEEHKWQAIPLTHDILLKCGFRAGEYHTEDFYHAEMGGRLHQYNDGSVVLETTDDVQISETIKYLHQLQNLYFALTGEELKIEL